MAWKGKFNAGNGGRGQGKKAGGPGATGCRSGSFGPTSTPPAAPSPARLPRPAGVLDRDDIGVLRPTGRRLGGGRQTCRSGRGCCSATSESVAEKVGVKDLLELFEQEEGRKFLQSIEYLNTANEDVERSEQRTRTAVRRFARFFREDLEKKEAISAGRPGLCGGADPAGRQHQQAGGPGAADPRGGGRRRVRQVCRPGQRARLHGRGTRAAGHRTAASADWGRASLSPCPRASSGRECDSGTQTWTWTLATGRSSSTSRWWRQWAS